MVVTILRPLEMSDAGRMRVLSIGQVTDLPDVVASRLIDRGVAASQTPALREHAITGPDETGRSRRRR